jgi:hypothetical protein
MRFLSRKWGVPYSNWLPDSGFEPDGFPMLEHYLNDVRNEDYVEMEIFVKLKNCNLFGSSTISKMAGQNDLPNHPHTK